MTLVQQTRNILRSPRKLFRVIRNPRNSVQILMRSITGVQFQEVINEMNSFSQTNSQSLMFQVGKSVESEKFQQLAESFHAGKQNRHGEIYSKILPYLKNGDSILEIGIGSTNPSMPSTMGKNGSNGASLQMWAHLFPNSTIVGADVDKSSFVTSKNIECYEVDQRSTSSLKRLKDQLYKSGPFQLIIDDGLHTPETALRSINCLSDLIKPGGFWVTDNIDHVYSGLFRVFAMAQTKFEGSYFEIPESGQTDGGFLCLRRKTGSSLY